MTKFIDYFGTSVSWLCLIHCLAMPFLISFLSVVGLSYLADETTEIVIIGISVCLAMLSFVPSYFRHHRKIYPMILFLAGITLIISAHRFFEESLFEQAIFLIIGAGGITAAHLLNRAYCKSCENCEI